MLRAPAALGAAAGFTALAAASAVGAASAATSAAASSAGGSAVLLDCISREHRLQRRE